MMGFAPRSPSYALFIRAKEQKPSDPKVLGELLKRINEPAT
jgi:hypothetical protein